MNMLKVHYGFNDNYLKNVEASTMMVDVISNIANGRKCVASAFDVL